mmetsp:Transcript_36625/g.41201  ORF Transcript_36625/g.41201 Transcript_36625/m.41201 type:complete len:213 (+) Transcript_36625:70-708(+)
MSSDNTEEKNNNKNNNRASQLGLGVSPSIIERIRDSDGNVDINKTVVQYAQSEESNKILKTMLKYMVIGGTTLIIAMIAISIAVAFLTRQTHVDTITGLTTTGGGDGAVVKTNEYLWYDERNINDYTVKELFDLKALRVTGAAVSIDVKGIAKKSNETVVLVEGGRIIFGLDGEIFDVVGDDVYYLLAHDDDEEHNGRRKLHWCICAHMFSF